MYLTIQAAVEEMPSPDDVKPLLVIDEDLWASEWFHISIQGSVSVPWIVVEN